MDFASSDEYVRLSGLIEIILPCTTPEVFTMKKTYTVVEAVDDTRGKWPSSLGNGWFTDSKYLVEDLIDMIVENVPAKMDKLELEFSETMTELGAMFKERNYAGMID